jgi:hypothetical protein
MKSKQAKVKLSETQTKQKHIKIRINMPKHSTVRLGDMNQDELRREIDGLPHRITEARMYRDKLMAALKERWSTAYVNDQEFVTAYAKAEAAGSEVMYLLERAVKASRVYTERYGGKLL